METSYDRHCQNAKCYKSKYEREFEKNPDKELKWSAGLTEEISRLGTSRVTFWQKMSSTRGIKHRFLLHHY